MATTADKLQQLRLERQKSDLSRRLQAVQADLERSENEKSQLAEESTTKIKQALSLLDTARQEIDKLKTEKSALQEEVTELRRQNQILQTSNHGNAGNHGNTGNYGSERYNGNQSPGPRNDSPDDALSGLGGRRRATTNPQNGQNQAPDPTPAAPRGVRRISRAARGAENKSVIPEGSGVVRRQKKDEEERPLSLAERMSMFESKGSGGRNFGGGGNTNGNSNGNALGTRKSWRDNAPPKVSLSQDDEDDKKENNDVMMRMKKPSPRQNRDNRYTMPPNMFSSANNQQTPAPTIEKSSPTSPQESGKIKLGRAVAGIRGAIETEKRHKGIETGSGTGNGFMGLLSQVAPKAGATVKRAHSVAAPTSASAKKQALIHWCQKMTEGKSQHVDIKNFSSSWNNGMAFCALFHHFVPDRIPIETLDPKNREYNFRLAFEEGEKAGVTALLDVEDCVSMKNPDWMSVMTYVSLIYNHFNGIRVGGPRLPPMPDNA